MDGSKIAVRQRYSPLGRGHLITFEYSNEDGQVVGEVFTLASMADVLGVTLPVIEARYRRGNLKVWHVDIYTGYSRPIRGFPKDKLDAVLHVLQTRGARVALTPEQQSVEDDARRGQAAVGGQLVPLMVGGEPRYTIQALVTHTGMAESTVRKRLSRAGLLRRMVDLPLSPRGGRAQRAFTAANVDEALMVLAPGFTPDGLLRTQIQKEMASVATPQPESQPVPDPVAQPAAVSVGDGEAMAADIEAAMASLDLDAEPAQPVPPLSTTCFTGTPTAPVDDAQLFADIDAALSPTPTQP